MSEEESEGASVTGAFSRTVKGAEARGSGSFFVLQSGRGKADFNMALDEALLESAARHGEAVFRLYSWADPASSFGYFQRYREVERLTLLRPLVRRPTGGGIVPHDHDWTYSLVFPPQHSWFCFSATESYRGVHQWIQRAFSKLEIATDLAASCRKAEAGQCFIGHEKFDLLWRGQKIAGAAQRRTNQGLLIQGSVQPPPVQIGRTAWERAMLESAPVDVGTGPKPLILDSALSERVQSLADQKYSQLSYNQKR